MITQLEVRNSEGSLLTLPIRNPQDGYYIAGMDGLDPVKANLVSTSYASMDGAQFQSARRDSRNILLTLGMDTAHPTKDIRKLRTDLYSFFMPKDKISLKFYDTEQAPVNIDSIVESFEASLFIKEPGASISMICMDPDFYVATPTVFSASTTDTITETQLNYIGSVDTGFVMKLNVNRTLTGFTLFNRQQDNTVFALAVAYPFIAGDVVTISTIPGKKSITLTRAGIVTSILYTMTPQSVWVDLKSGVNNIRIQATGAAIPYTITYNVKYGAL